MPKPRLFPVVLALSVAALPGRAGVDSNGGGTAKRPHWAFQPLSAAPEGSTVDSFVAGKLSERGLAMSPEADRRTLIRRLYLDLHGLPPTPEEVEAFVNDADPGAWGKLVDRLLASPLTSAAGRPAPCVNHFRRPVRRFSKVA